MAGRRVGHAKEIDRRQRKQPQRLNQHAALRIDLNLFAHQSVKGEAQRQAERDQRHRAELPQLHQHADGRQQHRQPLQPSKALAQKQHAEHHVNQWVNKVAEARFEHMLVIHRPDKQQPVAADRHGGQRQQQHLLRLRQHAAHL